MTRGGTRVSPGANFVVFAFACPAADVRLGFVVAGLAPALALALGLIGLAAVFLGEQSVVCEREASF